MFLLVDFAGGVGEWKRFKEVRPFLESRINVLKKRLLCNEPQLGSKQSASRIGGPLAG